MDNNTMNQGGQSNDGNKDRSVGPVIGLVLILAMILLGGIYFWKTRSNQNPENLTPALQNETVTPEAIREQGTSDETSDIEADLNAFGSADIEKLGSDL